MAACSLRVIYVGISDDVNYYTL